MTGAGRKVRADELLARQGLTESRSKARAMIMAGEVRVGDRVIGKPSEMLDPSTPLELQGRLRFVSRGGLKLEHGLESFGIDVTGVLAADIGASTGGFTDCLLQRGAAKVYAIDVGYGQLDYRLRTDPRVTVMERVNARHLETLPEPVDFACVDVSFISLVHILPAVARLLHEHGNVVVLIKPQFEAGREKVSRGGVVREPNVRRTAVERVLHEAAATGFGVMGLTPSPITGPAGNVEYLSWLKVGEVGLNIDDLLRTVFSSTAEGQ
jgi:23S rRNA (cytidine1920-2'-O)/16S rRNA (cytidine1409-2'-O)-methyltransferase